MSPCLPGGERPVKREEREVSVEELEIGDLIEVSWLDASEARTSFSVPEKSFDTPVRSIGVYGGIRGERAKHLIIIKEEFDVGEAPEYHYNAIPLGMIDTIRLARRRFWRKRDVKKAMRLLDGFASISELDLGRLRKAYRSLAQPDSGPLGLDGLLALGDFWLRGRRGLGQSA